MIRKIVSLLLVFTLVFIIEPNRKPLPEANAAAPVLVVAPGVAIGLLELLLGAVVLAAAVGVISASQKAQYSADINADIASIEDATRRGIEATNQAITRGLAGLMRINGSLGTFRVACPTAVLVAAGLVTARTSTSTASSSAGARNANAAGECDPSLRGSPFDCCPDFMRRFGASEMSPVGRFAYRIEYWVRGGYQRRCCFEWDSMHGRFEVYERSNHNPFNHKGEKACARAEDMDNLCQPTYPEKADQLSLRHSPRNGCP